MKNTLTQLEEEMYEIERRSETATPEDLLELSHAFVTMYKAVKANGANHRLLLEKEFDVVHDVVMSENTSDKDAAALVFSTLHIAGLLSAD